MNHGEKICSLADFPCRTPQTPLVACFSSCFSSRICLWFSSPRSSSSWASTDSRCSRLCWRNRWTSPSLYSSSESWTCVDVSGGSVSGAVWSYIAGCILIFLQLLLQLGQCFVPVLLHQSHLRNQNQSWHDQVAEEEFLRSKSSVRRLIRQAEEEENGSLIRVSKFESFSKAD